MHNTSDATAESTILIVDDNPDSREILADLLAPFDYRLLFASNGDEAVAQATAHLPDLILLDVMLPVLDGFGVCKVLRSDPRTAEVPILIVTSLHDRQSRLRGIEAGADDFLAKPVDSAELRARVRAITRLNRYRRLNDERRRTEERMQRAAFELAEAYDATIAGWARALDLRDRETEGHSQRVTTLTVHLARSMGLCEEQLVHIRRGALLHDIGKLGIPDAILLKPGALNDDEWLVMRRHPAYAYEMLRPIAYLDQALDIPYCHHEKWDGTGYPRGLAGEQIPLAARIFALVDIWDALRSERPYRPAWPEERVRAHIYSLSGTHLDPQVVEAFAAMDTRIIDEVYAARPAAPAAAPPVLA